MDMKKTNKKKKIVIIGISILLVVSLFVGLLMVLIPKKENDDIMDIAFQAFLDEFYIVEDGAGVIKDEDFWQTAEIFEVFVDAYEKTGEEKYKILMKELFNGFIKTNLNDWSWNEFNDDIMWMVIGCSRAYMLTNDEDYRDIAIKHFDIVFERAWSDDLGGGLFWRIENTTKNSCINSPAVIAACLIEQITKDKEYINKAKMIYEWQRKYLFDENTGNVYDAYDMSGKVNQWASTYNQGTFIGAATLLYQYTREQNYFEDAKLAADYAVNTMFGGGVMNTEDEGKDLPGFKGILARWLYRFSVQCDQPQYQIWLKTNADTAWSNRNERNLMSTAFQNPTPSDAGRAWGCSAGVAVIINS